MVVGQGDVHHWSAFHLTVNGDGSLLNTVQAENGGLWGVDDWGTEQGTEDTTVGDGEGTAGHVLQGQLTVSGLVAQVDDLVFDFKQGQGLCVSDNRGHQTLWRGDGDGEIHVVSVDHGVAVFDGTVDGWDVLGGQGGGSGEGTHETHLDSGLLDELVLVELSHLHEGGHVDLVEGGQGGGGVLGFL